jgi:hypothetical protein
MKRRRNTLPRVLGLLALGALTCGIREDELRCEEAVAHLVDCCPGFDAKQVDCYYASTGCGTIYPVFDIQESRCIAATKCPQIVEDHICSRAQGAQPTDTARVCP